MFSRFKKDIGVVFERDPAARNALEVILSYPGFHALILHRAAHSFQNIGLKLIARLISQFGRLITGIEIHPAAKIGEGFFIDHGMGVVIGETCEIGDNVTLYQGVTLGGTGKEKGKRHPTIKDNVVVSAGALVLGSITVGSGSKIGAGSVVLRDVPENCTVVGVPGKIVKREGRKVGDPCLDSSIDLQHHKLPDPIAETIVCLEKKIDLLEKRINDLEEPENEDIQHAK